MAAGTQQEQRADVLFRMALALGGSGEDDDGAALEQARSALLAVGDRARAAEAEARLGELSWLKGHRDSCFEHLGRAQALVRDEPASAGKAYVLSELARYRMLADEFDAETGREALELAEALGLDEVRANALITNGTGRVITGDPEGMPISGGARDRARGQLPVRGGPRLLQSRPRHPGRGRRPAPRASASRSRRRKWRSGSAPTPRCAGRSAP